MENKHLQEENSSGPMDSIPAARHDSGWNNYRFISQLGRGAYGSVCSCLKLDTKEVVAIKTITAPKEKWAHQEILMVKKIRSLKTNKCNIVHCYESFRTQNDIHLVFEALDISLLEYMQQTNFKALPLNQVRCIIQQMAVALDALKSIGVIHTDVHLDNIMVVNRFQKPLRVKLIDFGLAIHVSKAKQGSLQQPVFYRSPEIILGLPFSEAIDIWSLGCVMADMMLGYPLFPGVIDYDVMRYIVNILGQPEKHLLDAGLKTRNIYRSPPFYDRSQPWKLMSPEEYAKKSGVEPRDLYPKFKSLDELKKLRSDGESVSETAARRESVNLLKEMLQMDAKVRITPSEILAHPFITQSCLLSSSRARKNVPTPPRAPQQTVVMVEPQSVAANKHTDEATEQQPDNRQQSPQATPSKSHSIQEMLVLESVSESDFESEGPAHPAVDAATSLPQSSPAEAPAVATSVPQSSPAEAPAVATSVPWIDAEQTHISSESSEPKKKKKKNKVRRFFSAVFKAVTKCFKPKRISEETGSS